MMLRIRVKAEGQYPTRMFIIGIIIPIADRATAPLHAQLLPKKMPYATMNDAMPIASRTEPQTAIKLAVDSTTAGTAVSIGAVDARNEAKYKESIPLNVVKIPLMSNTIPTNSTPAGFSACISVLVGNSLFTGFTR